MKAVNTLLVVALLLFATVMSWTYFAVRGENQNPAEQQIGIGGGPEATNTSYPNYRVSFLRLLPEHGNLAITHLTSLYDAKDTSETAKLLEDNAIKLADTIKQLGTDTDREEFLKTFRGHISEYENYTNARKNNDQAAMNTAKENLTMHAMEFGKLANKVMPSLSEQDGTALMNDHGKLTLAIVDAHADGNTTEKLNRMKDANLQAVRFANELAEAADKNQNNNNSL